jgi:multiple sugar transport system permease protein
MDAVTSKSKIGVTAKRRNNAGKKTRSALFDVVVGLVVLAAAIGPVVVMVRIALTPKADIRNMPIEWFAGLDFSAFISVLNSEFPKSLWNSAVVALLTTVIVVAMSAMAGHALARLRGPGRERFLMVVLGTRMGPAVIFAIPIYLLAARAGLVDSLVGVLAVYLIYNLAFGIWLMHGFFLDIAQEIEEAALVDGLNEWGVFARVSLPIAAPGLIATSVLIFIMTWNEFFYAFVLTARNWGTFPTTIPGYFGAFQVEWGLMFAANTLGIIVPVIFGVMARRWLARGFAGGMVD